MTFIHPDELLLSVAIIAKIQSFSVTGAAGVGGAAGAVVVAGGSGVRGVGGVASAVGAAVTAFTHSIAVVIVRMFVNAAIITHRQHHVIFI